jgi:purine-binding chemotaxis protein CheW
MTGVDWTELRRRLDDAVRGAVGIDEEQSRLVLSERARLLARTGQARQATRGMQLLKFMLGGEAWGLDAALAWDVVRVTELAHLPGTQAPYAGVVPWRGTLLTVLDLRPVLGIPTVRLDDLRFALVIGTERPALGVLADEVHELTALDVGDLLDPPEGVAVQRDCLSGVTRASLPVLDVRRIVQRYG